MVHGGVAAQERDLKKKTAVVTERGRSVPRFLIRDWEKELGACGEEVWWVERGFSQAEMGSLRKGSDSRDVE